MAYHRIADNEMFKVKRFDASTKAAREAEWLEFRATGVGGSDMGAILGLNKYSTPYLLWLEKTGRSPHEDISDKWAVVKGNVLEGELRKRFKRLHPELEVWDGTDKTLVSNEHPCMHASLDGYIYDPQRGFGVLEIKTANANRGRADWHDDDGNLIAPDYYMAQVTHYLAVTGWTYGVFYADIGEPEPVEVWFERDEEDIDIVVRRAEEFWRYVTDDVPPALTTADEVRAVYPQDDGDLQPADSAEFDEIASAYEAAAADEKAARDRKKACVDRLAVMVGEHQGITSVNWQVTYKTQCRAEHIVKASTTRVLRVKALNNN